MRRVVVRVLGWAVLSVEITPDPPPAPTPEPPVVGVGPTGGQFELAPPFGFIVPEEESEP